MEIGNVISALNTKSDADHYHYEFDEVPNIALQQAISSYYSIRRTGKVYQTKLPKYNSSNLSSGTKTLDNAGLTCTPSTPTEKGTNDYADIPMFQWVHCNYIREDDGTPIPTAIEGMNTYTTSGSVDVGAMQMSFWYNYDYDSDPDYIIVTVSDKPNDKYNLVPWPECVRADGTMVDWCIGSSYISGIASDGLLRSQPNLPMKNFESYNTTMTNYQKKGTGYWGAGDMANTFQIIMLAIKYNTKNSQTVFPGCTNYSFQYQVAASESGVKRVLLTSTQANNVIVGAVVSVGDAVATSTVTSPLDRGYTWMRNIADLVKVTGKETVGDNVAIYLDIPDNVDIPSTAYISSMPWYSGSTDGVLDYDDGYIANTDKYPYRIQGREYLPGAYTVSSDTIFEYNADQSKNVYVALKGTKHTNVTNDILSTYKFVGVVPSKDDTNIDGSWWIGDMNIDVESGVSYPVVKGSSSSTGTGDYSWNSNYADADGNSRPNPTGAIREYLRCSSLGAGSSAGACGVASWDSLAYARWDICARD